MDFNLDSSNIFTHADSFTAFTQNVRPGRPVAALDGSGLKCELKQFDSVYNAKGDRVLLRSGTKYNLEREVGSHSYEAALIETKFWNRDGDDGYSELQIRSPHMKAAIKAIVPEYKDLNIELRHVTIRNEPRCLFHYRNELFLHGQALAADPEAQRHVSFLLQYMQQTLSDAIYTFTMFVEFAVPSFPPALDFNNLWMIFKGGDLVVISERTSFAKSVRIMEFKNMSLSCRCDVPLCRQRHKWDIEGYRIDFDGSQFGYIDAMAEIKFYEGCRNLSDLIVMPLHYHPDQAKIRTQLLPRGQKFVRLQGSHYCRYKGAAKVLGKDRNAAAKSGEDDLFPVYPALINGRIVIDPKAFYEARPAHGLYMVPSKTKFKVEDGALPLMSEEQYLICDNVVAGFALNEKKWGYFNVELIQDIEFDNDAFKSSLILEEKYKKLIVSLIQVHSVPERDFDDVITGKGKGIVLLLHGDPGVGKTLTAESVADHCRKPLLRIDASTLGTTAESVEDALSQVFQLAEKWNAVVLLDEADVFMEQREPSDLERNSLVAVFLRVLEYYEGILFLTTNRIESFDRAFKSRIHLAIQYPKLDRDSRKSLWWTFLSKTSLDTGIQDIEEMMDELASEELNGRQIKNIVRIAQALAFQDGQQTRKDHIIYALDALKCFDERLEREVLESGTGIGGPTGSRSAKRRRAGG